MNVQIVSWAGEKQVKTALAKLGYEDRQEVEGDPHELAKKFFDEGLNVMLLHTLNGVILALDSKSFYQR